MESNALEFDRIKRILGKLEIVWRHKDINSNMNLMEIINSTQSSIFDNPCYIKDNELELRLDKYINNYGI